MVGANDDVVVPKGREELDWECEFAVVVGRPAKYVPVADAPNYIFGYSIEFDVSDRENRGDRKMGGGPDWFVQKNHDTFAPVGPFIVPKEFVPDPDEYAALLHAQWRGQAGFQHQPHGIQHLGDAGVRLKCDDAAPRNLISMGTPPGTNIERQNPRWMKAGDVGVCVVEGVGEQRHKIVDQN